MLIKPFSFFLDEAALKFDELLLGSRYYWPLDGKENKEIFKGTTSINYAKVETIERGLLGQAVGTRPVDGPILLSEITSSLINPFVPAKGVSVALWLYYQSHNQSGGQIFLMSGSQGTTGIKFYQPEESVENVALEVRGTARRIAFIFRAPQKVWTHYVFTWTYRAALNQFTIYVNGKMVKDFVNTKVTPGNYTLTGKVPLVFGANGSQFPSARFDDIAIWERCLASQEIPILYQYYKGKQRM